MVNYIDLVPQDQLQWNQLPCHQLSRDQFLQNRLLTVSSLATSSHMFEKACSVKQINMLDTDPGTICALWLHVGGSSKIQTLRHMTQVLLKLRFTAMERLRLLKLVFFTYKCTGILLSSIYITQRVLATPTLIGTWSMNIINIWILLEPLTLSHMKRWFIRYQYH